MSGSMYLDLENVIKYYKQLPHQKEAIKLLQEYINKDQDIVTRFLSKWRQLDKIDAYTLLLYPTEKKDSRGLIIFNLDLLKNGKRIDRVCVNSGAPSAQVLLPPEKDYSGSLRPIPEGNWIVHPPEKAPYGSWGEGLGEWWIELTPINPRHNRKNIGIHLDANREYSPGSAGCIVTSSKKDLEKIITWIWNYGVKSLTVTYNFTKENGFSKAEIETLIKQHAKYAVGYAEGNLTLNGNPKPSYYGHTDYGNGKTNIGAYSYQGKAKSPQEADELWTNHLIERLSIPLSKILVKNNYSIFILLNVCDLYTQAPLAVTDTGGLLEQISGVSSISEKDMIEYRVASFYDPVSKKIMAAGFGNNPNRLRQDQQRRVRCIIEYLAYKNLN